MIKLPCTLAELETAIHRYGDVNGFDCTVTVAPGGRLSVIKEPVCGNGDTGLTQTTFNFINEKENNDETRTN